MPSENIIIRLNKLSLRKITVNLPEISFALMKDQLVTMVSQLEPRVKAATYPKHILIGVDSFKNPKLVDLPVAGSLNDVLLIFVLFIEDLEV
jgi:hypothetical protein